MHHPNRKFLLLLLLAALLQLLPMIARSGTTVSVPVFKSVALRGGGEVFCGREPSRGHARPG